MIVNIDWVELIFENFFLIIAVMENVSYLILIKNLIKNLSGRYDY